MMNKKNESEKAQQFVTVRLARPGYIPVAVPARLKINHFPLRLTAVTRFGEFELIPNPHEHVNSQEAFESAMGSEPPQDPDPHYVDAEGWFSESNEDDEEWAPQERTAEAQLYD